MTGSTHCTLIITTHDWSEALGSLLASVRRQSQLPDEVIVTDVGGSHPTRELLLAEAADFPTALRHVWHEDGHFHVAGARNRAIAASSGDYLVCIDGGTVLHPDFVADHLALAESGAFLHGNCFAVSADYTAQLVSGLAPTFAPWIPLERSTAYKEKRRYLFRWQWLARRKADSPDPRLTMASSSMSFWREDLVRINGYNERMLGQGRDDLEIEARLRNSGVRQRRLKYAGLALRLYRHSDKTVHPDDLSVPSNQILRETVLHRVTRCENGLDTYLEAYRELPQDLRTIAVNRATARSPA